MNFCPYCGVTVHNLNLCANAKIDQKKEQPSDSDDNNEDLHGNKKEQHEKTNVQDLEKKSLSDQKSKVPTSKEKKILVVNPLPRKFDFLKKFNPIFFNQWGFLFFILFLIVMIILIFIRTPIKNDGDRIAQLLPFQCATCVDETKAEIVCEMKLLKYSGFRFGFCAPNKDVAIQFEEQIERDKTRKFKKLFKRIYRGQFSELGTNYYVIDLIPTDNMEIYIKNEEIKN